MVAIIPIPAFTDNYIWLVRDGDARRGRRSRRRGAGARLPRRASALALTAILVTHHHARPRRRHRRRSLRAAPVPVFGPARETIPGRTQAVARRRPRRRAGHRRSRSRARHSRATRRATSPSSGAMRRGARSLFCGDTLFAAAAAACSRARRRRCGRRCRSSRRCPATTRVYCGARVHAREHRFALRGRTRQRGARRARGARAGQARRAACRRCRRRSAEERATNPFLRAAEPAVRAAAEAQAGRPLAGRRRGVRGAAGRGRTRSDVRTAARLRGPLRRTAYHRAHAGAAHRASVAGRASASRMTTLRRRLRPRFCCSRCSRRCATPAPAPDRVAAAAAAAAEPPRPSPPTSRRAAADRAAADPFPPAAGAELEPLPPPADDLWERIVAGLRDSRPRRSAGREVGAVVRGPARLRRAHGRPQPALSLPHRRRGRGARHADRDRAAADDRERVQPERALASPRLRHLAVHPVDRQALRARSRTSGSTRAATCVAATDSGARLPARSSTATSATGSSRSPPTTGARATSRGRSRRTGRRACRPTTRASTMPAETRNYLPKLQAVKNIVRDPEKYGLVLADIPDAPYFAVVKTTRKMDVKRAAELAEMSVEEFLCAQSAAQPAGHRRRRRAVDPAADRQRRDVRREARAHRPAARVAGRRTG